MAPPLDNDKETSHPRRFFTNDETMAELKGNHFSTIRELTGDSAVMLIPFDIDEDGRMDLIV